MEKTLLVVGLLLLVSASIYLIHERRKQDDDISSEVIDAFQDWKEKYNKKYSDTKQDTYRLRVFNDNFQTIKAFYDGPPQTYTLTFTQFMDLTPKEFQETYLGYLSHKKIPSVNNIFVGEVANSIDWRDRNVLNEVKDQGQCGSCWAFSTIGSLEPAIAIKTGQLPNLSEQQLVDCSKKQGNQGCNGGLMTQGFDYIKLHGIETEAEYPYTARNGKCKAQDNETKVTGYYTINDCDSLKQAVNQQPVSVAVDASNWSFYGSGVFTDCQDNLNHGVVLVGYGDQDEWIVRNSWSSQWGESGYIRLAAGNTCGVCSDAVYPLV